jgi:hypothetical protein
LKCVTISYRLRASVEYGGAVEVLVVFDRVAVLDNALGAAVRRWGAVTIHQHLLIVIPKKSYSSDVSAFGWIWMRIDREAWSPARTSYRPSTLRAESSSMSWLILMCARAA